MFKTEQEERMETLTNLLSIFSRGVDREVRELKKLSCKVSGMRMRLAIFPVSKKKSMAA